MISDKTIQQVLEAANIVEVVGDYVPLKRKGQGFEACCPFHKENTPSFHVSASRGIYKCFGCGKGGDAVHFIIEHERKSFPEAVELLAAKYNIAFDVERGLSKEDYAKQLSAAQERAMILAYAEEHYHKSLLALPDEATAWQKLFERGYSRADAIAWRIGYAADNSKNITDTLINKGWYNTAISIGIIKTNKGVSYDFLRNRITLPIRNHKGELCGFSGRNIGDDTYAKYVNPPESEVYDKASTLFGLYESKGAIKQYGYAYLVEGNFDVITMHLAGADNTVAPCGTALTIEQVKLLRKHTHHVVIIGDGDAAGQKAMMKQIDLFLAADMRTEVVELPAGEDPDTFVRHLKQSA